LLPPLTDGQSRTGIAAGTFDPDDDPAAAGTGVATWPSDTIIASTRWTDAGPVRHRPCALHADPADMLTREAAVAEAGTAPVVAGYHHFAPTVSDVEASAQWYERVFGMTRVPVAFPHHGGEEGGYAVVLMEPRSGIVLGLHHHDGNPGQLFDERRTGLDHMSFAVAGRTDLDAWASWLDSLGVENSGVTDTDDPVPYSVVVFRDPDNIQLELIYMAG
jgi:catechol 2,3-dioxygenase-like lactoylglutathione lyase family enzyme